LKVACADVHYGKSTQRQSKKTQLADLPLNELLIQLDQPHFVSPPTVYGPTQVGVGLFVQEVTDLSASDNSYGMEGFLDLLWCDPRLAFSPEDVDWPEEVFLEKDAARELQRIWWPDVSFINEKAPRQIENEELIIKPDGTTEYRERFFVSLSSHFDMRRFPFDTQKLTLELESFAWSSRHLAFQLDERLVGFSSDFSVPSWKILDVEENLQVKREIRDQATFSELITEITVKRDPGYYIFKIIIPMITIVGISWSVFWMIGYGLADRLGVSFTGVLTIVAYQFIVSQNLPRHIYNNFLDGLVLLSFFMLVLTIMENIVVNMLCRQGQEKSANSIDYKCRWLFPACYLIFLSILIYFYLL
nr:hypothetical protein [Leptolyngbyaceae cyanobacterium MO_188.B28]